MTYFIKFCLSAVVSALTVCASISVPQDLVNLSKDCSVPDSPLFMKLPKYDQCSNWTRINLTSEIKKQTESDVQCLLYYDSFTSFCTKALVQNLEATFTLPDLTNYINKDKVCSDISSNTFQHNVLKQLNETRCKRLCYDYDGSPNVLCSLSHFLRTLNLENKPNVLLNRDHIFAEPVNDKQPVRQDGDHLKAEPNAVVKSLPNDSANHIQAIEQTKTNETKNISEKTPETNATIAKAQTNGVNTEKQIVKTAKPEAPVAPPKFENVETNVANQEDATANKVVEPQKPAGIVDTKPPKQQENKSKEETNTKKETVPPADTDIDTMMAEDNRDDLENYEQEQSPPQKNEVQTTEGKNEKPSVLEGDINKNFQTEELEGDSYFFSYFTVMVCLVIVGYVAYHNRQKILALLVEGNQGRRQQRGRRPNSANYHKLDSNLEEAISSSCNKSTSNVIY